MARTRIFQAVTPTEGSNFSLEAERIGTKSSRHARSRIRVALPDTDGYARIGTLPTPIPSWSGCGYRTPDGGFPAPLASSDASQLAGLSEPIPSSVRSSDLDAYYRAGLLVYYTTRAQPPEPMFSPQCIALCFKQPEAWNFQNAGILLDPYAITDPVLSDYMVGDSEKVFSAWRDPNVITLHGRHHMFFSARYSEQFHSKLSAMSRQHDLGLGEYNPDCDAAIGHAVSKDLVHWKLCAPLRIPVQHEMMELPSALHKNGMLTILTNNISPSKEKTLGAYSPLDLDNMTDVHWRERSDFKQARIDVSHTYGLVFQHLHSQIAVTAFDHQNLTACTPIFLDDVTPERLMRSARAAAWSLRSPKLAAT